MFDLYDDVDFEELCARDPEGSDFVAKAPAVLQLEDIVKMERLIAYAQAEQIRLMAEFVETNAARVKEDQAESSAPEVAFCTAIEQVSAEVSMALNLSGPSASGRVHKALEISSRFPAALEALAAGDITMTKVDILRDQAAQLTDAQAAAVTDLVLHLGATKTPGQFKYAVRKAVALVDEEALKRRQKAAVKDRGVWMHELPDGMSELTAILPGIDAVGVMAVLEHHALETVGPDDDRTKANRMADALVDCIGGSVGHYAQGSRAADSTRGPVHRRNIVVDVRVTVPFTSMIGIDEQPAHLTGYGPITADLARRLAADGTWRRILSDPATGNPVDFGTTRYRPPAELRDAVTTRHPTCARPGCTQPAARCDLDHHDPHHSSGQTTIENLGPYCRRCHRLKQTPGWRIEHRSDGTAIWHTPAGQTYEYTPPPIAEPVTTTTDSDLGDPPF